MKSILNEDVRKEISSRIDLLNVNSQRQWGKMNVYQMVKHNTDWCVWLFGNKDIRYKQTFLGKLIGQRILKKIVNNDKPFGKNIPTSPAFVVVEKEGDFEKEKLKWKAYLDKFPSFNNPYLVHDFFEKMNKEEVGILAYKHFDHHLRQFGV